MSPWLSILQSAATFYSKEILLDVEEPCNSFALHAVKHKEYFMLFW